MSRKTRTTVSIFSLLLLLIPIIGCSRSSDTTDAVSTNAKETDTPIDEELDTSDEQQTVSLLLISESSSGMQCGK